MTRIAYLVTSAREMTLADGTPHPTGYFAEEALKPYERFTGAGFDVTVITPDGKPPYADPYGLSWFFHYPDEDKDYLASVVRTFAHDVDDIRLTLHQNTELGLAAARRVAALLQASGRTAAEAHRIGLINHVVSPEELDEKVYGLARRLAAGAMKSIRWTKQVVNIPLRQIAHATMDLSLSLETQSNLTKDHQEAVTAFAAKRRPNFTGD